MSTSSQLPTDARPVAVGLYEYGWQARAAITELRQSGIGDNELGLLIPSAVTPTTFDDAERAGPLTEVKKWSDVHTMLRRLGVAEGESRFYAAEVTEDHRALIVVHAHSNYTQVRETLVRHGGYDVESQGGDLAAAGDAGLTSGAEPLPSDLTSRWEDVSSRYEMLWAQHYGTTDATWEQVEPVYRFAWEVANDPRWRGRSWSASEDMVRNVWETSGHTDWPAVRDAIHDVWVDVAEDVAHGFEGGQQRRVQGPGNDQSMAVRDLRLTGDSTP